MEIGRNIQITQLRVSLLHLGHCAGGMQLGGTSVLITSDWDGRGRRGVPRGRGGLVVRVARGQSRVEGFVAENLIDGAFAGDFGRRRSVFVLVVIVRVGGAERLHLGLLSLVHHVVEAVLEGLQGLPPHHGHAAAENGSLCNGFIQDIIQ